MKALRCLGLLVVVLLSACDAQDPPAPKPKVAAEAVQQSSAKPGVPTPAVPAVEASVAAAKSPASEPVKPPAHDFAPNMPVVPVIAKGDAAPGKASAVPNVNQTTTQVKPAAKSAAEKKQAASKKSVAASKKVVKETSLNNAKLDLSLPPELAKELAPAATTAARANKRKPILPQMFGDKGGSPDQGPFELNGRLLSNEMQLQMRNDNRRDVEGAALDFKFKQ